MKIVIGGDISVKEYAHLFAEKQKDKLFDAGIQSLFHSADEVIVNLECAVTDKNTPIKKMGPNLCAPFGICDILKDCGVTVCALSNNHIFDFGKAGIRDTFAQLKRCGLKYTGYGKDEKDARKDYIIEREGKKIAVVNVCEHEYTYALSNREGARVYDPYDTNDDIVNAKKNADYVIAIYHGGKEDCQYPSPRLVKLCRSMVHHGADVVLCQHSHCVGCYEEYNGAHILYGQGNFHFIWDRADFSDEGYEKWSTGLAVILDIDETGLRFSLLPTILKEPCLKIATGEDAARILSGLDARNQSLQDGSWIEGWQAFCRQATGYLNAIKSGDFELMAHYLDCEAHLDAIKERYKTWNSTNEVDDAES